MPPSEKNIQKSKFSDVTIANEDFSSALDRRLTNTPSEVALVDVQSGREYKCSDVKQIIQKLAANLSEKGLSKADTVAIFSPNSVEYVFMVLACLRLGARVALINALSKADELKKYISLCDATFLYTTRQLVDTVLSAVRSTPLDKKIIINGTHPQCLSLSTLLKQRTCISLPSLSSLKIRPERDTMAVLFSSGTTGMPKAVSLSHKNFLAVYEQTNHPSVRLHGVKRQLLIYQPMSHIFGFSLMTGGLAKGNPCLLMNQFSLKSYLEAIEKYRVEAVVIVPPIAIMLAKSPLVDQFDLTCVVELQSGGAPIKAETEREVLRRLPNANIARQGYGLTETTSIVCGGPLPGGKDTPTVVPMGSVGMLLPSTEAKVVDASGRSLGPNSDGELYFRGPQNMLGYLKNEEATRSTLDSDGWLHTGDIGHYNEDGFFFVVDRIKELIKYKAYQVAPAELEALILTHPKVEDVGIIGIPDTNVGEIPHAWVVPRSGISLTENEIVSFVAEKVAPYKKLRGGVKFVQSIPKSPSGKILRRLMRDQLRASRL